MRKTRYVVCEPARKGCWPILRLRAKGGERPEVSGMWQKRGKCCSASQRVHDHPQGTLHSLNHTSSRVLPRALRRRGGCPIHGGRCGGDPRGGCRCEGCDPRSCHPSPPPPCPPWRAYGEAWTADLRDRRLRPPSGATLARRRPRRLAPEAQRRRGPGWVWARAA